MPTNPPDTTERPRMSRRTSIIGSVVAVLALAGLGWYLTQPASEKPASAAAAGPGGPGGPGGGGAGRRGPPSTTVGVATAELANIPIVLEALGTVTPLATVRVKPQVSGVMQKVLFKEGQLVKSGELLATIDPRQFEMSLMQSIGQRQQGSLPWSSSSKPR
jgi:membrane fusion protein, multidrug efflux system